MKKRTLGLLAAAAGLVLASGSAWSCTVLGIGKNATADGSAMITHNDDSRTANSRLFIIPEADWPEGSKRPIIKDAHGYEGDAQQMDEIDQVPHTYRYFFSRYSFMNEKGVAIGEATNGVQVTDERSKKVQQIMEKDAVGSADAWVVQDVALERAKTAREAVSVMGKLVEEVGWYDSGETMPITDGNEVWIMEFYGNKIWAAWRVPDDQVFVAANRARLRHLDLTDKDNAGAALLGACKEVKTPELTEIGSYRGFTMFLSVENFGSDFILTLKGEMSHRTKLGLDARGNLLRIDNTLADIHSRMEGVQVRLSNLREQLAAAKKELGKPFPQEAELAAKSARLAELNAQLDMGAQRKPASRERGMVKSSRPSVLEGLKRPAPPRTAEKKHQEEVR